MIEDRVLYALKKFFNEKVVYDVGDSSYIIMETSKEGKTKLIVNVETEDSICFNNYDKFPKWEILNDKKIIGLRKCVDHFILKRNNWGFWELHIFEMKTSVGFKTWNTMQYKMRSSYFSIKAIANYLGISIEDKNIIVYTTYEQDHFKISEMSDSKTVVPLIGSRAINVKKDQWDAGFIDVPIIASEENPYNFLTSIKLRHIKIHMNRAENGFLENTFTLPKILTSEN